MGGANGAIGSKERARPAEQGVIGRNQSAKPAAKRVRRRKESFRGGNQGSKRSGDDPDKLGLTGVERLDRPHAQAHVAVGVVQAV
jgi:hypothetical protein